MTIVYFIKQYIKLMAAAHVECWKKAVEYSKQVPTEEDDSDDGYW